MITLIVFAVVSFLTITHFHLQGLHSSTNLMNQFSLTVDIHIDMDFVKVLRGDAKKTIEVDVEQYEKLLLRASELKKQYDKMKSLTTSKSQETEFQSQKQASEVSSEALKSGGNDLVIGMAKDIDPKNLAVFAKSLRKVSQAKTVLFINSPIPERHRELAKTCKIEIVEYDPSNMGFAIDISKFHPSSSRWPLINKYLEEHGSSYKRVWMLDVRDSYFQSDPFQFVSDVTNFNVFNGVVKPLLCH